MESQQNIYKCGTCSGITLGNNEPGSPGRLFEMVHENHKGYAIFPLSKVCKGEGGITLFKGTDDQGSSIFIQEIGPGEYKKVSKKHYLTIQTQNLERLVQAARSIC